MAARVRGAGVMSEGQDMAGILGGAEYNPFAGGPEGARPATRPPVGAAMPPAGGRQTRIPAVDSLDQFRGGALDPRPPARVDDAMPRWALPAELRLGPGGGSGGGGDGGGGGGGGGAGAALVGSEVAGHVAQLASRLGHLEQENAVMKRTMEMRDAEVRKASALEQVVKGVARQMSEIDETLRRASNAHDGAARRIRALEDAVGYGNDSGGAHAGRLHTLEESVRGIQAQCQGLGEELANAGGERQQAEQRSQAALDEASARLAERLENTEKGFGGQLRQVQDESRSDADATKQALAALAEDVNRQFSEVNGDVIPGLDRALREQVGELRRVVESSVTQMAEDIVLTKEGAERGRNSIRSDLKELQGVAQKGLLTLRAESEKQGKTLASIVKEEIATRALNFETVNKQIEEIRLQLDADMSANQNDLTGLRGEMTSQFELTGPILSPFCSRFAHA